MFYLFVFIAVALVALYFIYGDNDDLLLDPSYEVDQKDGTATVPDQKIKTGEEILTEDDAPKLDAKWFETAEIRNGDEIIRPGK